jgi:hypothetical protein
VKGHDQSVPLAGLGECPSLEPRAFDDEGPCTLDWAGPEVAGGIGLMGDRHHETAAADEDTGGFGHRHLHGVDILQAHERHDTVGHRIGKR